MSKFAFTIIWRSNLAVSAPAFAEYRDPTVRVNPKTGVQTDAPRSSYSTQPSFASSPRSSTPGSFQTMGKSGLLDISSLNRPASTDEPVVTLEQLKRVVEGQTEGESSNTEKMEMSFAQALMAAGKISPELQNELYIAAGRNAYVNAAIPKKVSEAILSVIDSELAQRAPLPELIPHAQRTETPSYRGPASPTSFAGAGTQHY